MNNIKVSVFGSDGYTCQIPRIREAMQSLGHVLSNETPDLIYSNDPTGYEKAMLLKKKFSNSYLMFNFLDVPWHMPKIREQTNSLVKYFSSRWKSLYPMIFLNNSQALPAGTPVKRGSWARAGGALGGYKLWWLKTVVANNFGGCSGFGGL